MNNIFISGRLTADPTVRNFGERSVTEFTVATDRRFKGQDGQKQTDFFRVRAWNKLGEYCGKYLSKGRSVALFGELQARTYTANDGTTRMSLDVNADQVDFLGDKPKEEKKEEKAEDFFDIVNSQDIPF